MLCSTGWPQETVSVSLNHSWPSQIKVGLGVLDTGGGPAHGKCGFSTKAAGSSELNPVVNYAPCSERSTRYILMVAIPSIDPLLTQK